MPIDATEGITVLYVFVDIKFDLEHFLQTVRFNFPAGKKLVRCVASHSDSWHNLTPSYRPLYLPFSLRAPFIRRSRHSPQTTRSPCHKQSHYHPVRCESPVFRELTSNACLRSWAAHHPRYAPESTTPSCTHNCTTLLLMAHVMQLSRRWSLPFRVNHDREPGNPGVSVCPLDP